MTFDIPYEGEDVNSDSSTENKGTQDVNKQEESSASGKTVPYDRFAFKVKENAAYREEIKSLREDMKEIKSFLKQSKEVDYDDMTPKELEKHIREQIKQESELEKLQEQANIKEAEEFIENFFEDLRDKGEKFDENEVMKLAIEEFDNDLAKAYKAYKREQRIKDELDKTKASQKAKAGESISSKKGDDIKSPAKAPGSWNSVYEDGFKYIK